MGSDHTKRGWSTNDIVFHQHPRYAKHFDQSFDIGIITLNTPIDWDEHGQKEGEENLIITTICLPKPDNDPNLRDNPFKNATYFGWGRIRGLQFPRILQRADVFVKYSDTHSLLTTHLTNGGLPSKQMTMRRELVR